MHTGTYKGKRVHLIMKNGDVIIDKYVGTKARYIIFEEHPKV